MIGILAFATLVVPLLRLTTASPLSDRQANPFASITPSTSLVWSSCYGDYFCAVLDVPLDYANSTGARAYVPILKKPATIGPYKGVVFYNPGGPGFSAIRFLLNPAYAAFYHSTVGTNYDILAYDPRGVGFSAPVATCSTNVPVQQLRKRLLNHPYGPRLPQKFYEDEYAYQQGLRPACAAAIGGVNDIGRHMSSAIVARDAISILDAYVASPYSTGVTNPGDFNFWGVSYGTVIGQTFAQLFPNRVGRFVLDGVTDAADWYAGLGLKNVYLADRVLSTFFTYCSKAGAACAFNTGTTSADVFNRFENVVLQLNARKAYQENWANKTTILRSLQAVKLISSQLIYEPISFFPLLAPVLKYFEDKLSAGITLQDITDLETGNSGLPPFGQLNLHPATGLPSQYFPAIGCSDSGNKALDRSLQQEKPITDKLEKQSWVFGELAAAQRLSCTQWSIQGKGRYTGGFGGNTKTPIFFVSNTRDPVTPLPNGVKGAFIYQNARLLTVDTTGHTVRAGNNVCAQNKINAYFQNGTLSTSFCPLEAGPWGVQITGTLIKRESEELEERIAKSIWRNME